MGGLFKLEGSKGYRNPFNRLKSFLVGVSRNNLLSVCNLALKEPHSNAFGDFAINHLAARRETSVFDYVKHIIHQLLPLSTVEDSFFMIYPSKKNCFAKRTIKKVIHSLVKCVEIRIVEDLCYIRGAIMHDRCSSNGTD